MRIAAHPVQAVMRGQRVRRVCGLICATLIFFFVNSISSASAQSEAAQPPATNPSALTNQEKVEQLAAAVAKVQAQMEANQKLLIDLQQQLQVLRLQMAVEAPASVAGTPPTEAATALEEIREHQAIAESQIATHELTKVETESKYPLKVSGLLLFNAFVNTRQVDIASSPAYVLFGSGSTGLSMRQTVLGLDARGPHLFGATSYADLRIDFFANGTQTGYSTGVLRLRTAHAGLRWPSTEAFIELDRSIVQPNTPSSLLAIGQPELAWAGNLWSWNPQIGVSHQFSLTDSMRIQAQAALIDAGDPRLARASSSVSSVTLTERSRWPGTEARIALLNGAKSTGFEFGLGGYFSRHRTSEDVPFNAWAGTIDLRLPIAKYFQFTANAYRGQALGGLGGGGYVDYVYRYVGNTEYIRALEDAGGWTQLQARAGQHIQFNAGYGIDNPFAREIHSSIAVGGPSSYAGLARNRSFFTNIIYSPSTYLLFSLEYRRLWTNYAAGPTYFSDVIGIGAGYKF